MKLVDGKKFEFLRFHFKNTSQHDGFVFFVTLKYSYIALSIGISKSKVWSPFTVLSSPCVQILMSYLRKRYNTRLKLYFNTLSKRFLFCRFEIYSSDRKFDTVAKKRMFAHPQLAVQRVHINCV